MFAASGGMRHSARSVRPRHGAGVRGEGRRVLLLVLLAAVIVLAGVGIHACVASRHAQPAGEQVSITVDAGASTSDIARQLADAGIISSARSFRHALADAGLDTQVQSGDYDGFLTGMTDEEAMAVLAAGPVTPDADLVIPEGYTLAQTAAEVERSCGIPAGDFASAASDASAWADEFPFLAEASTNSLEGYLFPKGYRVDDGATAEDIIRMMLSQYQQELSAIDLSDVQAKGYSARDVLIVASMVEKEVPCADQRADAASVVYNRLAIGMRLQMDSTVVYALGDSYAGDGTVTYSDLEVDSPYNTYKVDGLPPGPVCSPGADAIEAAAHPSDTDYLYFVNADLDGRMAFSSSYEQFQADTQAWESLRASQQQGQ